MEGKREEPKAELLKGSDGTVYVRAGRFGTMTKVGLSMSGPDGREVLVPIKKERSKKWRRRARIEAKAADQAPVAAVEREGT